MRAKVASFLARPRWFMIVAVLIVCVLWSETLVYQVHRWGQPYQGFIADPWGVVQAYSKYNGNGWEAGLRSFDVVVAANGQPWSELQTVLQQTGVGGTVVYTIQRGEQTLDIPVTLQPFDLRAIAEITGSGLLFAAVAMVLGIVVYRHNPDGYLNRVVLIYNCLFALIQWYQVAWMQDARLWSLYAVFPIANLAVACGMTLFWSYGADDQRRRFLARTHLIPLFWIFWGGYGLLYAVLLYGWLHSARPEFFANLYQRLSFPGYSFAIISTVGKCAPLLLLALKKSTPRLLRRQLLTLLAGFAPAYVASFFLWDFPAAGIYEPFANLGWGNVILILYPLSVAYAVLRYQAFDMRVVIRKGLVYSILTAGLTAIFLLLSMAIGYLFQSWTGQQTFAAAVLPALLVAVMFRPAQGRVQTAVDQVFFRKEYEVRQTLTGFGRGLGTLRDTGEVVRLVLDTITSTLGAENVRFWLLDTERSGYHPTPPAQIPDLAADGDLPFWLVSERRPLLLPPSDASPQAGALRELGSVLAVPLVAEQRLLGFLTLGTKRSGLLYTDDDIELLSNLAQSAALALENSRLHEERLSILREQLARVTAAQEEERQRIARELHDGIGPALASLKLRLSTTGKTLGRESPAALELNELADLTQANIQEIRRLIYDLRPAALDELGLVAALNEYVDRYQQEHGISVTLTAPKGQTRLPASLETTLFRVIQEALNNVARHSGANGAQVGLSWDDQQVSLRIADDGSGFDLREAAARAKGGQHLGLWSMRERIEQLGGQVSIESQPGSGTVIQATIPLAPRHQAGW